MRLLLDACVIYPTVMREILLGCAEYGAFQPFWSDRILEEWARAARKHGPLQEAQARGEIALIKARWPNAILTSDPVLESGLYLPDANDVHVLGAAIAGQCDKIVTQNLKDFPPNAMREHGLLAGHPDAILCAVYQSHPENTLKVAQSVRAQAESLSGDRWQMRKLMKKARLPRFGKALANMSLNRDV